MRRTPASLLALGLSLALALTVAPTAVSAADGPGAAAVALAQASQPGRTPDHERATQALERAQALFSTRSDSRADGARARARKQDATIIMRDLFEARSDLSPAQRHIADSILARPTDGASDPYGDGYTVPSKKKCGGNFCIHWVTSTDDAAPSKAWVVTMLRLMNKVWKKEVKKLGYRPPVPDGGRGGNKKVDVYLAQISDRGLYGYCAPERRKPGYQWLASGFCVLDNDFVGFPRSPIQSAQVTAAHEFFHAIQFGYDFGEDPWLLEATATWMEERVFDRVNDNRQYLPASQVADPVTPLDYFNPAGGPQYGNWVFFEYLSHKFGTGVVKKIWNKAGAFTGAPDMYSTKAITSTLKTHKGFKRVYSEFVSANALPAKFYGEGKSWGVAPPWTTHAVTLSRTDRRTGKLGRSLLHMSSWTYQVKSSTSLRNKKWHLKVKVDGPSSFRSPAAIVLVQKRKGFEKKMVRLNGKGNGQVIVPFSRKKVKAVYVSLVNASTRFTCGKKTQFSCQGQPTDDGRRFVGKRYRFSATVVKRG